MLKRADHAPQKKKIQLTRENTIFICLLLCPERQLKICPISKAIFLFSCCRKSWKKRKQKQKRKQGLVSHGKERHLKSSTVILPSLFWVRQDTIRICNLFKQLRSFRIACIFVRVIPVNCIEMCKEIPCTFFHHNWHI